MTGDAQPAVATKRSRRSSATEVLASLRRPKVGVMLALGFGSGLPFLLTGNTFGYWLREEGTGLGRHRLSSPGWGWPTPSRCSGRRSSTGSTCRCWAGSAGGAAGWRSPRLLVALGLAGMAAVGPAGGLTAAAALALVTAFASATQDIVIDAWRIEAADDGEELGLLSSASAARLSRGAAGRRRPGIIRRSPATWAGRSPIC